jgi:hypothetical protein
MVTGKIDYKFEDIPIKENDMKKAFLSLILVFTAVFVLFVLFSCNSKKANDETRVPDSVKLAVKNLPDDLFLGVGVAKTESDGESILLAEDRARAEIARQIDTAIYDHLISETSISVARTVTHVYNSEVILREKDKNGNWWCVVLAPKDQNNPGKPETADDVGILRSNASERTALMELKKEIIRNGEVITIFQGETSIPDWVFDPARIQPEDTVFGLGAAKLDNDRDSIWLASERARRSLAHSFDVEITSDHYTLEENNRELYQENNTSITSIFEIAAIPVFVWEYARSKDGTWWVLLGCLSQFETNFYGSALDRMNQAFDKFVGTSEVGNSDKD